MDDFLEMWEDEQQPSVYFLFLVFELVRAAVGLPVLGRGYHKPADLFLPWDTTFRECVPARRRRYSRWWCRTRRNSRKAPSLRHRHLREHASPRKPVCAEG